jgi:hypothetical protein
MKGKAMTENNGNGGPTATENLPARPEPAAPSKAWGAGVGRRGIELTSFTDLWKMAQVIFASGIAPPSMRLETVVVALEMGMEVGLSPMAAVRSIAVINGRPAIYGDAALALVRASGLLESFQERTEGEKDARRSICIVKRKGMPEPRITTFSVTDARTANLWGKRGPWQEYPDRMLQFRARGFALRDEFGDVLNGMVTVEEAQDIPPVDGSVIEAPKKGVAGLIERLPTKPVSEGQVLDTESSQVEGPTQAETSQVPESKPEPAQPPPVEETTKPEPPKTQEAKKASADMNDNEKWVAGLAELAESAGISPTQFANGFEDWRIKHNLMPGKEHLAKPAATRKLRDSIEKKEGPFAVKK